MRIRFVDVQVTEPQFAGDESGDKPLDPPASFDLGDGEEVASVTQFVIPSGTMGSTLTIFARVWITETSR